MNNFFCSWIFRTCGHRPLRVGLWMLLFSGTGASGQVTTEKEIVELPVFTVQDSRLLPEREIWRYARIPGFEVLSNASDRSATRLIRDFQRFHQALVAV